MMKEKAEHTKQKAWASGESIFFQVQAVLLAREPLFTEFSDGPPAFDLGRGRVS